MLANKFLKSNQRYRKKGHIHFATKKYSNPFFKEKKSNKTNYDFDLNFPIKIKFIALSLVLLLLALVGFSLYSNIFKITDISVNGEGRVNPQIIKEISENFVNQKYIKFLPKRNLLLFNEQKLEKILKEKYAFDELDISKQYPKTITINYQEKSYALVLEEKDEYFYLDAEGEIIDLANLLEVKKQLYPIVKNESNKYIENNKTSIPKENIVFILETFKEFKEKDDTLVLDRFIIDNELRTIKIKIENGPLILLNESRGAKEQIEKFFIVKNEKLGDSFSKKEYIDLRYGNSVYYR